MDISPEMLAQFAAVTGASLTEAATWIEMGGYSIDDAIELFFTSNQGSGAQQTTSKHERFEDYSNNFNDTSSGGFDRDPDAVRLPDQVKRQRLVEDSSRYIASTIFVCACTS